MDNIITEKEWKQFVHERLRSLGYNHDQIAAIDSAFFGPMYEKDKTEQDEEFKQRVALFLGQAEKGITEEEMRFTMNALRDPHSALSKGLKVTLTKERLDTLEDILEMAERKNEERLF